MVTLTLQYICSASPTQRNSESTLNQNALIPNSFNAPKLNCAPKRTEIISRRTCNYVMLHVENINQTKSRRILE